ncbi:hypothetical protein LCGC14_1630000 [marine sediment metagenome]|uniref:HTH cro/C1-type domain-containing protein n=1 Tax=marine sediment metagenome TaxID=412755 RepID=A0A0F9I2Z3_9ZZZZ
MGYNQKEFGKFCGVSQQVVSGIETDSKKPSKTFSKFIDYLYSETFGVVGLKETTHLKIISIFKDTEWAENINEMLLEIEGLDPDEKREIKGYLEGKLSTLKRRTETKKKTVQPQKSSR